MRITLKSSLLCLAALLVYIYTDPGFASDGIGARLLNQVNFSASLTTAGQPTEQELALIAENDYDRVIFLAFSNHPKRVPNEDVIVRSLGLQFIHIPVDWDSPSLADFETFAAIMQTAPFGKTLVHCEVNFRASVFGFLYQVLYAGADMDDAMSVMQSVWVPNDTWQGFIVRVMNEKGFDYPAF